MAGATIRTHGALERCSCGGFTFICGADIGGRPYLQVDCGSAGRGRKWWLSQHMTTSEIVRTAFMAVHAFVEHELREQFTFDGKRVFGPHIDVDALAEVADREDRRRDSQGAWEAEDG